jgi:Zn-dependent peptidase ImmA (M78 family)/transcriptional regulator with XRE-family HTH domain
MQHAMSQGEQINPTVLIWARESAGLAVDEAAQQIGLSKITGADKLMQFERGIRLPTRSQLAKIAKVYRRPLLTFYRPSPPKPGDLGHDFRAPRGNVSARTQALLDALLRNIKARQEMVADILLDEDDVLRPDFVGSCTLRDGVSAVALRISRDLRLDEGFSRTSGVNDLFKQLRERTEALGVFVLLVGDLGSHHSTIGEDVFRGFTFADKIAPFIIINDQDAKVARSFTLLHELTHIYLGQSGISGSPDDADRNQDIETAEWFCNDVAGLILLPEAFAQGAVKFGLNDENAAISFIKNISLKWSVSEPLVAFRLHRMGWISGTIYRNLNQMFQSRWTTQKLDTKAANRQSEGGPDYYVVKQHRLGSAIVDVTRRALRENRTTHTKAATILGVRPSSVEGLIGSRFSDRKTQLKGDGRK